jgi:3-hydroxybutyryl-CoA dehydrogenase
MVVVNHHFWHFMNQIIKTIGIIGAGTMGNGIAQACALAGLDAIVQDVNAAALEKALKTVSGSLDRAVKKGTLSEDQKDAVLARIKTTQRQRKTKRSR